MTTRDDALDEELLDSDDPDQEVEMGDIEARMDEKQQELDQLDYQEELDIAIDANTLADERQLDEA